jgi:hypothetical protein
LKESGTWRHFTHIAPLAFVILIPAPHPPMAGLQRRASQAESAPSLAADASELAVPFFSLLQKPRTSINSFRTKPSALERGPLLPRKGAIFAAQPAKRLSSLIL